MSVCSNPVDHSPPYAYTQDHHVVPLSWVREGCEQWGPVILPLCGTCHDAFHHLLNHYVRHAAKGLVVPWSIRRTYSIFIRDLVAQVWERRPRDDMPYTAAHPTAYT